MSPSAPCSKVCGDPLSAVVNRRSVYGTSAITPQSSLNMYCPPARKKSERICLSLLLAAGACEVPLQFFVWSGKSYSAKIVPPGPDGSSVLVPTSNTEQPQAQASAAPGISAARNPMAIAPNLRMAGLFTLVVVVWQAGILW